MGGNDGTAVEGVQGTQAIDTAINLEKGFETGKCGRLPPYQPDEMRHPIVEGSCSLNYLLLWRFHFGSCEALSGNSWQCSGAPLGDYYLYQNEDCDRPTLTCYIVRFREAHS